MKKEPISGVQRRNTKAKDTPQKLEYRLNFHTLPISTRFSRILSLPY